MTDRITFRISTSEPWEVVALLAAVLDFDVNPITIHDEEVTVLGDEATGETIRQAIRPSRAA